uniref:Uncharacterized protein n=1 Tax=Lepeophtheirus salmonis TaxID=72036 RepID=A0A0K2V407_LEPSM
MCMVCSRNLDS